MEKPILIGGIQLHIPPFLASDENLKTCWEVYAELPLPALPNGAKFFFHSGPGTLVIRWGWKSKYESQFHAKLYHWGDWVMKVPDPEQAWNNRVNSYLPEAARLEKWRMGIREKGNDVNRYADFSWGLCSLIFAYAASHVEREVILLMSIDGLDFTQPRGYWGLIELYILTAPSSKVTQIRRLNYDINYHLEVNRERPIGNSEVVWRKGDPQLGTPWDYKTYPEKVLLPRQVEKDTNWRMGEIAGK